MLVGLMEGHRAGRQLGKILVDLKSSSECIIRIFMAFDEGVVLLLCCSQYICVDFLSKLYCEVYCGGVKKWDTKSIPTNKFKKLKFKGLNLIVVQKVRKQGIRFWDERTFQGYVLNPGLCTFGNLLKGSTTRD